MNPCSQHLEDLALLAGGDLPEAASHELRRHVATCEGCARMLGELEGDQACLAACVGQHVDVSPVMGSVMARIAAESSLQAHGAVARPPARAAAFAPFAGAAAVVLVVVGAAVLGVASLHEDAATADNGPAPVGVASSAVTADPRNLASMISPAAMTPQPSETGLPMSVQRSGGGVVLTWAGDGRERLAAPGHRSTYEVRAASTPDGIESARPVEVAGSTLVASMELPAARFDDRSVTFFRVE